MLRAVVTQSEIGEPLALSSVTSMFEAVRDRIVWYSDLSREYIAIAPDGCVDRVKNLALPNNEKLLGSAIGPQGEIFASSANGTTWSVSRLDLRQRTWSAVSSGSMGDRSNPLYRLTLIGAEGDSLVATGNDGRHVRFVEVTRQERRRSALLRGVMDIPASITPFLFADRYLACDGSGQDCSASAIVSSPATKKISISPTRSFVRASAPANSFQAQSPHRMLSTAEPLPKA